MTRGRVHAIFDPLPTHHYFSIAKAKRDLGYEPVVDLDEGIARTIAALKA
jgi:nucleoside-diphosphate-sugar epimerase